MWVVALVDVGHTLLGLLQTGPRHGFVEVGSEPGDGPDRKRYAITPAGVADVETWLAEPERPEPYLRSTLHAKVVLALLTGRDGTEVLDTQRAEHLRPMRELTRRKSAGDLADQLVCDHALFHLEADVRWLELTPARLDDLALRVRAWASSSGSGSSCPSSPAPRTSRCPCGRRRRAAGRPSASPRGGWSAWRWTTSPASAPVRPPAGRASGSPSPAPS